MNRTHLPGAGLFALLVALGALSRLLVVVYPAALPNFHAVIGATLLAGFLFRSRLLAAAVPLVSMWLSDLVLGGYEPLVMATVYASLAAPVLWRSWLRRHLSPTRLAVAAIASSLLFFATTNLAVWYHWYPHTGEGLVRCYLAALPFLRYTLAGDLTFSGALFGCHVLAARTASAAPRALSACAAA